MIPTTDASPLDDSSSRLSSLLGTRRQPLADLRRVSRSELSRLVRQLSARGPAARPIDPTAAINEVARRLLGAGGLQDLPDREDFLADLSMAFREILRRGVGRMNAVTPLRLSALGLPRPKPAWAVDTALTELEARQPSVAQAVGLALFGGLTTAEIARQTHRCQADVVRELALGNDWLRRRLTLA